MNADRKAIKKDLKEALQLWDDYIMGKQVDSKAQGYLIILKEKHAIENYLIDVRHDSELKHTAVNLFLSGITVPRMKKIHDFDSVDATQIKTWIYGENGFIDIMSYVIINSSDGYCEFCESKLHKGISNVKLTGSVCPMCIERRGNMK